MNNKKIRLSLRRTIQIFRVIFFSVYSFFALIALSNNYLIIHVLLGEQKLKVILENDVGYSLWGKYYGFYPSNICQENRDGITTGVPDNK